MNAQTARQKATRAAAMRRAKEKAARRAADAKLTAEAKEATRTELPRHIRKVRDLIAAAVKQGEFITEYTLDGEANSTAGTLINGLQKHFAAYGYSTSISRDSGTADMGDSAAPCIVPYSNITLHIRWNT